MSSEPFKDKDVELAEPVEGPDEEGSPPRGCNKQYLLRTCCNMNIYWRTLIWFTIVLVYLLIGGAIFYGFERPNEQQQNTLKIQANQTLFQTINKTIEFLITNGRFSQELATELVFNISRLSMDASSINTLTNNWEYPSSVFFASTVVTTIGYGTIAPTTTGGRGFFIPYAIIGIPITLIFLAELGQILKKLLNWVTTKPLGKRAHILWVQGLILLVVLTIALIVIAFIPAAIFAAIDGWTYFEAVYFVFVTLTTVGFGDFVPTTPNNFSGLYRLSVIVWLFVGLAFLALVIAKVQEILESFNERRKKFSKCMKEKMERKNYEEDVTEAAKQSTDEIS